MNRWLYYFLFTTGTALAQRPTAEAARSATSFWPLDARTGAVVFTGPTARPSASALWQAEHLRTWLTQACGREWSELRVEVRAGADSAQLYRGQLRGMHPDVGLRFAVRVRRELAGWQYQLFACEVRSPTGTAIVHWLPLHRLLDDPDFRPDVRSFQSQLQRTLPGL
jgi:hypothetical protein